MVPLSAPPGQILAVGFRSPRPRSGELFPSYGREPVLLVSGNSVAAGAATGGSIHHTLEVIMKHNISQDPRNIVVKTRLSCSEKAELDSILERTKLSQAEYLRCAIFGIPVQEAPKPVLSPIEGLDKLIAQYGRIGNNLNQIARWLNSGGYIDRELSHSLRSALGELNRLKYDSLKIVSNYYGNHQAHCQ